MELNTKVAQFPGNIVAGIFGIKAKEFFEANEAERQVVKADFSDMGK